MITILIIYSLFVAPYILVFPTVYEYCTDEGNTAYTQSSNGSCSDSSFSYHDYNDTLRKIEMAIDIIYLMEILMNFVKKSRAYFTFQAISLNYI